MTDELPIVLLHRGKPRHAQTVEAHTGDERRVHGVVPRRDDPDHTERLILDAMLDRTTSGNVTINGTIMHVAQDDLPFGGVGESGIGKYHAIEGFRTLSHAKGIFVQGRWNFIELLRAPCGKRSDALLNFFLR
jgi:hypothetical protein